MVVAAAVGFGWSDDGGKSWSWSTEGLHDSYLRAACIDGGTAYVSASDGPFTKRGAVYRAPLGSAFVRCAEGLPKWFPGNVDTGHLDAVDGGVVIGFGQEIHFSEDGGESWRANEFRDVITAILWVPRTPSNPFTWTFATARLCVKMDRGALLPLRGLRSLAPAVPDLQERARGTGHRSRHGPSRGLGPAPPGSTSGPPASRQSDPRRAEPVPQAGASGTLLRPARDLAPVASRSGASPMDVLPPTVGASGGAGWHGPAGGSAGD